MEVNHKKMWKATGGIKEREEMGGVEGQSIMVSYQWKEPMTRNNHIQFILLSMELPLVPPFHTFFSFW